MERLAQNYISLSRSPFGLRSDTTWLTFVLCKFIFCAASPGTATDWNSCRSRSILAMFWLGIQGANGAQCITIMIEAIWPSYANIKNTIPANQGIDTKGMIRSVPPCVDRIPTNYLQLFSLLDHSASPSLDPTYQTSISICHKIDRCTDYRPSNHGMVCAQGRWFRSDLQPPRKGPRKHEGLSLALLHVLGDGLLVNSRL